MPKSNFGQTVVRSTRYPKFLSARHHRRPRAMAGRKFFGACWAGWLIIKIGELTLTYGVLFAQLAHGRLVSRPVCRVNYCESNGWPGLVRALRCSRR